MPWPQLMWPWVQGREVPRSRYKLWVDGGSAVGTNICIISDVAAFKSDLETYLFKTGYVTPAFMEYFRFCCHVLFSLFPDVKYLGYLPVAVRGYINKFWLTANVDCGKASMCNDLAWGTINLLTLLKRNIPFWEQNCLPAVSGCFYCFEQVQSLGQSCFQNY